MPLPLPTRHTVSLSKDMALLLMTQTTATVATTQASYAAQYASGTQPAYPDYGQYPAATTPTRPQAGNKPAEASQL